jgi:hypothetical protein
MHGILDRVPITPHGRRQSDDHRWGTGLALLAHTLRRQHKVVEVDQPPRPGLGPALTRRAAAGPAAQGGAQAAQRPIPACHEGGMEGRSQPPARHVPTDAAGATINGPRDDVEEVACGLTPLDDLAVEQRSWRHHAGLRVAPAGAAAAALVDPPQDLQEGGRVGFPAIAQPLGHAT